MLSRPYAVYGEDENARRDVVKKTYENAVARGDKNVYFIDGETFFKDCPDREICFIDRIHPNDYGFHIMASKVEPVIKKILENL
jgi:lysophospholipase L1-like esterase